MLSVVDPSPTAGTTGSGHPDGEAAASAPAVAISLEGVAKTYRVGREEVAAVHPLDVQIADGEFFSLLGPSGCGKSTTLRMIAGFEEPDEGVIRLHGRDVTDLGPHRRDVNMVFQGYALFPHLDVWNNIAFGLRRRRIGKSEIKARVDAVVEMVGLNSRVSRMPRELSGGQQQRVALARALVNRPRALLLDEPLGALDLQLRQSMQLELKRIQREAGITFVYVTHDQTEALTMSDRVAVMNEGRIEQCADPRTIYESPTTPFVAGFIGTSNLFTVTTDALSGSDARVATTDGDRLTIPVPEGHRVGEEITLSVRPEKVVLSATEPAGRIALHGTIAEIAYLGMSTSYVVQTRPRDSFVVFDKNGPTSEIHEIGEDVWLSWPEKYTQTFAPTPTATEAQQ